MPIVDGADMISGAPLPGWSGRFFHSANMTFAHWDIADGATDLHEHHHEQEEVWHIVDGAIVLAIDGDETLVHAGMAAVIPPNTPHAAKVRGACRAIVVDHPRREQLPGMGRS